MMKKKPTADKTTTNKVSTTKKRVSKKNTAKVAHPKHNTSTNDELSDYKQNAKRHKVKGAAKAGGEHDIGRFLFVWLIMLAGFAVLVVRAAQLQIVQKDFYIKKGEMFTTGKISLPVSRGMITDTLGMPLAVNAPLSTITFNPYEYAQEYYNLLEKSQRTNNTKAASAAKEALEKMDLMRLATATNYPLDKLQQAVSINPNIDVKDPKAVQNALPKGAGSKRLVLQNDITPELAQNIVALDFFGVHEEQKQRRYYLQAEPNAQIIGYMGFNEDNQYKGRTGIEAQYETQLAGRAGQILILKNARQGAIEQIKEITPEIAGQDVVLTIDSRLQYVLYKELEQVGREQSALWTSGMIVDVQTGDVLAMGSWPSFNTNNLNQRKGTNEKNRPVLDVFEPGSVIKPFTVAAALESKQYNTNTLIDTGAGSIRIQGNTIKDGGAYGEITLGKLIQKSSNVASAKIALHLPSHAMVDMQRRFGFGQKTALNFPFEATGRVDTPKEKDLARRATLSYGYGQQVTLAQIAQAYATLGARGVRHPLRLVKNEAPKEAEQILDEKYANAILGMMELVTEQGGTGKQAAIDGYRVAGKTGTSRRTNPAGGYYANQHRAIFAGVAPASNPRFAVAILVENPQKASYAGPVSAPPFAKVMKEALRLYNVPFDKPLNKTLGKKDNDVVH